MSVQTKESKWVEVASVSIENAVGGAVTVIDTLPDDAYKIRITYNMPGEGSLAIDDVLVEWGGEVEAVGEVRKMVQAPAESLVIDGLTPSTVYYYRVQATDGEQKSAWSDEIRVPTTADSNSAIDRISATGAKVACRLSGDVLYVDGVGGETVVVADMYGRTVFSTIRSDADNVAVRLPVCGMYVVRIGQSNAIKIRGKGLSYASPE